MYGENELEKVISKLSDPNFLGEYLINEWLVLLEFKKKAVIFDKPIYTGFSILEISKAQFYALIYDVIKKYFSNATIAYIDTDSCIFETDEDPYKTMQKHSEHFDMSVFPENFFCYSEENKGKLGTFKDEFAKMKNGNLNVVCEFLALRSKCYIVNTLEDKTMKCKGVKKDTLYKLTMNDFKAATQNPLTLTQKTFRSKKHKIYTVETKLNNIVSNDDKKRVKIDNNLTVPYGHYLLN